MKYSKYKVIRHDIWHVLSSKYWLFVILLGTFFILIPFSTAGLPGQSIFNIEVTHAQMRFRFIHQDFLVFVQLAAVVGGAAMSLNLFSFLRNKRDTTIFMSLGISRWQLFYVRAAVGMLMLAVSVCLPMLLSLLLNKLALGLYPGVVQRCFYLCGGICLTAFVSFFIMTVVCAMSGTLVESLLYGSVIGGGMTMVLYSCNLFINQLLWGGARGVTTYSGRLISREGLVYAWNTWNPLLFFYEEMKNQSVFMRSGSQDFPGSMNFSVMICWCVILAGLFVCAYMALKYRKAEITGITGTNKLLSELVISITAFFAGALVFSFLSESLNGLAFIAAIVIFLLIHVFWRKTMFTYETAKKSAVISALVQLLLSACYIVLLITDGFGHTNRILQKEDFVSARFSYVGNPNYLSVPTEGSSTVNGYYVQCSMEITDSGEINRLAQIQQEFVKSGKRKKKLNTKRFSETVVPYDIEFSYTDTMGQVHYWYYDRASLSQLSSLLKVDEFKSVKRSSQDAIEGDVQSSSSIWSVQAYQDGDIYLSDSRYLNRQILSLDETERKSLLKAIGTDVKQQTLQDTYYPEQEAKAVLMFTRTGEHDDERFSYHLNNTFVYVTAEFTNTCDWLESRDLLERSKGTVESITLQKFNPYENINGLTYPMSMYFMSYRSDTLENFLVVKDFGKKYTISGKEEISQLSSVLRNTWFMDEGGYLAAVKTEGVEGYSYLFIPDAEIPDFVKD
jgi:ABC-2 type transport system permease protein